MKLVIGLCLVTLAGCSAMRYEPAAEQRFSSIAADGCNRRDGDFIIRGVVSNAYENIMVLQDPADPESTMSVTLPGRGTLSRLRAAVGTSMHEASRQRLTELGNAGTPVVVTLQCKGNLAPQARNISYSNADGSRSSMTF
jgi:hypothetical protein